MRLLENSRIVDGRRVRTVDWEGAAVDIRDDADTALRIIELFADEGRKAAVKLSDILAMVFVDPLQLRAVDDLAGLIAKVCWEIAKLDVDGSHKDETGGERVIDWDGDADYIQASLLMCYGVPWDEVRYRYSYAQLTAMLGLVDRDTPLGQALHYRTAEPPKRTPYNDEDIKAFYERRRFWALKPKGGTTDDSRYKAMSDATDALFASFTKRG